MFLTGKPCFNVSLPVPRLSLSSPWTWDAETMVNSANSKWKYTQKYMTEEGYYTHASFHNILNHVALTSPSGNNIIIYNADKKNTKVIGFSSTSGVCVQQTHLFNNSVYVMGDTEILIYKDILANEKFLSEGYIDATSVNTTSSKHSKLAADLRITLGSYNYPLKTMCLYNKNNQENGSFISVGFKNEVQTFDINTGKLLSRVIIPYSNVTTIHWSDMGLIVGSEDGIIHLCDHRSPYSRYLTSLDSIEPLWEKSYHSPISAIENGKCLNYLLGIGTLGGDVDVLDLRYLSYEGNKSVVAKTCSLGPISSISFSEHHIQYLALSSCGDVSLLDLNDFDQPIYTIRGELTQDKIGIPRVLATSMPHSPLMITTAFEDGYIHIHNMPDIVSSALCKRTNRRLPSSSLRAERIFGIYEGEKDSELIDDMLSMYHAGKYDEALNIILHKSIEYSLSGEVHRSEQLLSLVDMLEYAREDNEDKQDEFKDNYNDEKDLELIDFSDIKEENFGEEVKGDYIFNGNNNNNSAILDINTDVNNFHAKKYKDATLYQNAKDDFKKLVFKYGSFDLSPYKVTEDVLLIRNTLRILNSGLVFLVKNSALSTSQIGSFLDSFTGSFQLIPSSSIMSPDEIVNSGMASLGLYFYKPALLQGISFLSSPKPISGIIERPYERLFSTLLLVILHVLLISVGDALNAMLKLRSLLQTWSGGFENILSPLPIILETLLMPSIFSQDSGFSLNQMISIVSSILDPIVKGNSNGTNGNVDVRIRKDIGITLGGDIAYFSDVISEMEAAIESENIENANENEKTPYQVQSSRTKAMMRWKSATADESSGSYDSSSSTSEMTVSDNLSDRLTQDISTPSSTNEKNDESENNSLDMNFTFEKEENNEFLPYKPETQYGTLTWCVRELFKEAGKAILTPFKGTGHFDKKSPVNIYGALEDEAERIVVLRQKIDEELGRNDLSLQQTLAQTQASQFQQTLQGTITMSTQYTGNDERTSRRVIKIKMPMPGANDSELYRIYWVLTKLGTEMNTSPGSQPATVALLSQLQVILDVAEGKSSISTQAPVLVSAPLFLCAVGELLAKKEFSVLRKTLDIHFRMVLEARGLRYKYLDVEKSGPMTAPFEVAILEVCKTLVWPMLVQRLLAKAKGCAEACGALELLLKYLGSIPTLLVLKDLSFLAHIPTLIHALATQFILLFKKARQGIGFGDVENVATLIRKISQIHLVEEAGLIDSLVAARDDVENLLNLKQKR